MREGVRGYILSSGLSQEPPTPASPPDGQTPHRSLGSSSSPPRLPLYILSHHSAFSHQRGIGSEGNERQKGKGPFLVG